MTDNNKKVVCRSAVSGAKNKKAYIETEISRLEMEDYVSSLVPTEK
jgi:transcriptional antiterminator NusG